MSNPFDWNDNNQTGETANESIRPNLSRTESLSAVADMAYTESPFFSGLKYLEKKRVEQNDSRAALSPEELNDMYPDMPEPFQEPEKPAVAALIAGRQRLRQDLLDKISMGPDDTFQTFASFGTGIVYGLMDPLSVGTAVVAEAALLKAANSARVAMAAQRSGSIGTAAKGLQFLGKSGYAAEAARDVTAGLVEGSATEGIVALSNSEDLTPYTTEDFFMNTVGGAVLMPALGAGLRGAGKGLGVLWDVAVPERLKRLKKTHPDLMGSIQNAANGALDNGSTPNTQLLLKDIDNELNGTRPSFAGSDYKYTKVDINNLQGKKVFAVIDSQNKSGPTTFDFESDGLLVVTDSPMVANGIAGSKYGPQSNRIAEVDINDNITVATFDMEYKDGKTLGQVIQEIKEDIRVNNQSPDALQAVYDDLRQKGYDGIGGSIKEIDPTSTSHDHNQIALFAPEKYDASAVHSPDTKAIGKDAIALEEGKTANLTDKSPIDSQELKIARQNLDEFESGPKALQKPQQINESLQADITELDTLNGLGVLDEDMKAELENLKASSRDAELINEAYKAAIFCVGD